MRFLCRTGLPMLAILLVWFTINEVSGGTPVSPLPKAHAHNDYWHERPLLDALDHGFCSVEADVFLVGDTLLVGHSRLELNAKRTLKDLYLDPLKKRVDQNGGRVFPGGPRVMLLVDFKSDGEKTYQALDRLLPAYGDMLSRVVDGEVHQGAVEIVVSGDRPKESISADSSRYVGIDGRLSDLDSDVAADLMPLISDRWTSHFRWRGKGQIDPEERQKLKSIVTQAHQAGRRVRFWATPETPEVWDVLVQEEVDHLNTDRLNAMRAYFDAASPSGSDPVPNSATGDETP